mgnify:FL=1
MALVGGDIMRITVFTPTYNRAYIIDELYNSLKKQTFIDFEWLIIDDGSTDCTYEKVKNWSADNTKFPIRYYKFENSGKQKEINRALDLARGELFFTVDSDDLLTADALDKINQWEKTIPQCEKFCGFAGSDGDMTGKAINPIFSEEYVDATFFNRYAETGMFIGHDRPWVFYTDVHRQYRYPEFEGEKFIAEAVVWNRMAKDGYQIRCFNDVIYLIEHQEDGYTKKISQILIQSPKGYGLWKAEQMSFLKYGFLRRIKEYYIFYCDLQDKYHWRDIAKYIQASAPVMMFVIIAFKLKHIGWRK